MISRPSIALVAAANNAKRRAGLERPDHFHCLDFQCASDLARRVAADHRDAAHRAGAKNIAQDSPQDQCPDRDRLRSESDRVSLPSIRESVGPRQVWAITDCPLSSNETIRFATSQISTSSCFDDRSFNVSIATSAKPCSSAQPICRSVTGEQLPERMIVRSTARIVFDRAMRRCAIRTRHDPGGLPMLHERVFNSRRTNHEQRLLLALLHVPNQPTNRLQMLVRQRIEQHDAPGDCYSIQLVACGVVAVSSASTSMSSIGRDVCSRQVHTQVRFVHRRDRMALHRRMSIESERGAVEPGLREQIAEDAISPQATAHPRPAVRADSERRDGRCRSPGQCCRSRATNRMSNTPCNEQSAARWLASSAKNIGKRFDPSPRATSYGCCRRCQRRGRGRSAAAYRCSGGSTNSTASTPPL